jgi:hypothetical protein
VKNIKRIAMAIAHVDSPRTLEDGIFSNEEGLTRLTGALLLELHEQWTVGKQYNDMADYHDWIRERETEKLLGMKRIKTKVCSA